MFAALAVALILVGAGSAAREKTLTATVNGAGAVSLVGPTGRTVARLSSGRYVVLVRDRSSTDSFHLIGPTGGPNKRTTARFVGTVKWRVFLVHGKYRYLSDRRPAVTTRYFAVR
jgi:hypothetical protein